MIVAHIIEEAGDLTINDIDLLIQLLEDLRKEKFNSLYKVVEICNSHGNVSREITERTGFHSYHKGRQGYCGNCYIVIPIEKYTDELKADLLDKYNL